LACIVYWQAWKISWVLSQYDPVAMGIDLPAGTRQPIEWDNVVLYGQYILAGSSSTGAVPQSINLKTEVRAGKKASFCPKRL